MALERTHSLEKDPKKEREREREREKGKEMKQIVEI